MLNRNNIKVVESVVPVYNNNKAIKPMKKDKFFNLLNGKLLPLKKSLLSLQLKIYFFLKIDESLHLPDTLSCVDFFP